MEHAIIEIFSTPGQRLGLISVNLKEHEKNISTIRSKQKITQLQLHVHQITYLA